MATVAVARRKAPSRWPLYVAAIAISLFILIPIYLIAVAAFTPRVVLNACESAFLPEYEKVALVSRVQSELEAL